MLSALTLGWGPGVDPVRVSMFSMDPTTGTVLRQLWQATMDLNRWWESNGGPWDDFMYSQQDRDELKELMDTFQKAAIKWRLLEPPD